MAVTRKQLDTRREAIFDFLAQSTTELNTNEIARSLRMYPREVMGVLRGLVESGRIKKRVVKASRTSAFATYYSNVPGRTMQKIAYFSVEKQNGRLRKQENTATSKDARVS